MPIIVDLTGPPGTGLDLSAIWLNTAADLSDVRSFTKVGGPLSANTKARVDIRQLAANRTRLIQLGAAGRVDRAESETLPLVHLTREDVAWLKARAGVLMCLRDHVGTKFYGAWREAPREIQTHERDWINVSLSVEQVTHSEAV